jgi:ATP-binding protein involved in chromosome partitioning
MALSATTIRDALRQVHFPGFSRDIVSFGIVKAIAMTGRDVRVELRVVTRDPNVAGQIRAAAERALAGLPGVGRVDVQVVSELPAPPPAQTLPPPQKIDGVKRVVAVGSGKGGVGKSTVAVNLACALHRLGQRIGVMDADIYGPSVPKMMGRNDRPTVTDDKLDPVEHAGLKLMSMALLLDESQPVIWRGPMINKAIQQFAHEVNWGDLDLLLVDLPPGTGDAQLSLCQTIALDGGVIVTTPQDVALDVARRGIAMFARVNVPILGLIENMSCYVCPHCGQRDDIFGHGGGRQEAERLRVPFLGEVPLFAEIRACGDRGEPVVVAAPDSPPAQAFMACAKALQQQLAGR